MARKKSERLDLLTIVSAPIVTGKFEVLNSPKGDLIVRVGDKEYVFHYYNNKINLDSCKSIKQKAQ